MISGHKILKRLGLPQFQAPSLLSGSWTQTIAAQFYLQQPALETRQTHWIELQDGDQIAVLEYRKSEEVRAVAVLVHGLNGSFESDYIQRMSKLLIDEGFCVYAMNMRNIGPGKGLSKGIYHGGRGQDVVQTLQWAKDNWPGLPLFGVGYSLGGNLMLAACAGQSYSPSPFYSAAICPPTDLSGSAAKLDQWRNRAFNHYFFFETLKKYKELKQYLEPSLPIPKMPGYTLREFDDQITSQLAGFKDAQDYYESCGTIQRIHEIKNPCLLLAAFDDPVVEASRLVNHQQENLDLVISSRGGHLGFLHRSKKNRRWMDQLIHSWIMEKLQS